MRRTSDRAAGGACERGAASLHTGKYQRLRTSSSWRHSKASDGPVNLQTQTSASALASGSACPHTLQPIALDVEYTHVCLPDGKHASFAAWICMVAPNTKQPLLKVYCRHPMLDRPPATSPTAASQPSAPAQFLRSVGGVRLACLHDALPLADALVLVKSLWRGKLLVGHGLSKDLASLGLDLTLQPDSHRFYDTITFPKFQGKGGTARSLRRLAQDLLGETIQPAGQPHDPEEDARAVLRLYLEHARPRLLDNYEDLVQHYMQQYMVHAESVDAEEANQALDAK